MAVREDILGSARSAEERKKTMGMLLMTDKVRHVQDGSGTMLGGKTGRKANEVESMQCDMLR